MTPKTFFCLIAEACAINDIDGIATGDRQVRAVVLHMRAGRLAAAKIAAAKMTVSQMAKVISYLK